MGMGGGGKGGGGFMPNPVTGAPRMLPPSFGSGQQNGLGQGSIGAPPGASPINSVGPSGGGMAYAGGSNTFNEAGNQTMIGNNSAPVNPGASPITNAGTAAAVNPQVMGDLLKRWDGTGQLGAQPGVPDRQMGYQQPGGGASMPPGSGPPTGGVPGIDPRNFGTPSPQDPAAMALAQATGNQAGLNGAGSFGTNSAVNAAGPGTAGWNPQAVANAGVMNGPSSFKVPAFAANAARARGMTPQQYAASQGNTGIGPNVTWDQVTG